MGADAARADGLALHVLSWSQGVAVMAAAFRDEGFIQREVVAITAWLDELPELSAHKERPCSSPS